MWSVLSTKPTRFCRPAMLRIGPLDYNIYSNSQLPNCQRLNDVPLKAIGNNVLRFGDIGKAEDSSALQYNIVRVDGQKSVYLPILRQGGNSNTIQIVNGIREHVQHLLDVPKSLITVGGFRSIGVCQNRHCERIARRRHGTWPDRTDDSGFSRLNSGNDLRALLDPDLLPGRLSAAERFRQHHQHHGRWAAWRWCCRD